MMERRVSAESGPSLPVHQADDRIVDLRGNPLDARRVIGETEGQHADRRLRERK